MQARKATKGRKREKKCLRRNNTRVENKMHEENEILNKFEKHYKNLLDKILF